MLKRTTILLIIATMVLSMATVSLAAAKQVLKVGSDVAYPPFEYVDENTKEFVGFDMDFIRAVGDVLGVGVDIINTAWDGIIPGLLVGNYDIIISAMTITQERAKAVNFSDPYFTTGQVIAVKNDEEAIEVPEDLKGKVVAVQIGTTGQFAAEKMDGIKRIDSYNSTPEAFVALRNGAANAVVCDELVALEEMNANPGKVKVVGGLLSTEDYGIAVNKSRKQLLADINSAIAQLKADGTYDKIYNKWFGTK